MPQSTNEQADEHQHHQHPEQEITDPGGHGTYIPAADASVNTDFVYESDWVASDPDCDDGIPYRVDEAVRPFPRTPKVSPSRQGSFLYRGSLPEFYTSLPSALKAFRERLLVRASFLPLAVRRYNHMRLLYQLSTFISGLRKTRKYVTRPVLASELPAFNTSSPTGVDGHQKASSTLVTDMLLLHGLYPVESVETNADATHYANPKYVHSHTYPHVTDPAERVEWLERYARLAIVSPATVAEHFGLADDPAALRRVIRDAPVDWTRERHHGQRVFGRTVATALAWGYDADVVAPAWNTTPAVVRLLASRVVEDGFEPPHRDPTVPPGLVDEFDHADVDVTDPEPSAIEWRVRRTAPQNTT